MCIRDRLGAEAGKDPPGRCVVSGDLLHRVEGSRLPFRGPDREGQMVYRGCDYALAFGGVSDAYANSDASNTGASIGSRLAFRGKIVRAQSDIQ